MQSEAVHGSVGISHDPQQRKRMRAGSISGRLRTASDLEESGVIDKYQKGYIKDLIISGDAEFQAVLDRYEKGDKSALEDMIRSGKIGRRQSIDLLDDLDFDFLNALTTDGNGNFELESDLLFDFNEPTYTLDQQEASLVANQSAAAAATAATNAGAHSQVQTHSRSRAASSVAGAGGAQFGGNSGRARNASTDSTASINSKVFDNIAPYLLVGSQLGGEPNSAGLIDPADREGLWLRQAGSGALYQHQHPQTQSAARRNSKGSAPMPGQGVGGSASGSVDFMDFDFITHHTGQQYQPQNQQQQQQHYQQHFPHHFGEATEAYGQQQGGYSAVPQHSHPTVAATTANNTGKKPVGSKRKEGGRSSFTSAEPLVPGGGAAAGLDPFARIAQAGFGLHPQHPQQYQFAPGSHSAAAEHSGGGSANDGTARLGTNILGEQSYRNLQYNLQQNSNGGRSGLVGQTAPNGASSSRGGQQHQQHLVPARPSGYIGAYSPEERRRRIEKFLDKRTRRVWTKKVKYDVRKNFADSRVRVKGRFVKKEDEDIMREILNI